MSPFRIWKQKFLDDFECTEKDLLKELFFYLIPHILALLLACAYIIGGTLIFQQIDDKIAGEAFCEALLFSFSTLTTIGYGKVVPTNSVSQTFCVIYCAIGIPIIFFVFANLGEFLSEAYHIFEAWLKVETENVYRLPLQVALKMILLHSVLGGLIFHFWIDQMDFISAIYFSFISVTTIGYGKFHEKNFNALGDLNPTPDNIFHTIVVILYLSHGIVIMSTLLSSLSNYLRTFSKLQYN